MPSLTICIIVKNAASTILQCLESVRWANEIIIVDSGSTDNTLEICRKFTPKIWQESWHGFGPQKNLALQHATSDWILSIDADEWLDPLLTEEIQRTLQAPTADVYAIPRRSKFCGRYIKHAWSNDYVTRLFKRNSAKFSDALVHEQLVFSGQATKLQNWLWHNSCDDLQASLDKMNNYSTLSAKMKFQQGRKGSLCSAITHGLWTFVKMYLLKLGFLDGREGFILAVATAEGSYYRYLKLMYLQEQRNAN